MLNKKALAASVSAPPSTFVDDVFSTYLYTGNDTAQTITNNIDLDGEGGLVCIKNRSHAYGGFAWYDTARGVRKSIQSNSTAAQYSAGAGAELTAFNSNGFSIGTNDNADVNLAPDNYASWTFRKQPKFFDVVTYTGTGATQNISHNLGSAPGFIITKITSATGSWACYHNSLGAGSRISLNATTASIADANVWNNTSPTSSVFTVGASASSNVSGATYVAYLFAHDAGGFGDAGTDNVISCGTFNTDGSGNADVNLGYEAQYVMIKASADAGYNWDIQDIMRGAAERQSSILSANLSAAEVNYTVPVIVPTATGFKLRNSVSSIPFIYMAIRRPMKVPTTGTEVFEPVAYAGDSVYPTTFGTLNAVDMCFNDTRDAAAGFIAVDRLRDARWYLQTTATTAETNMGNIYRWKLEQKGIIIDSDFTRNQSGRNYINYNFRRAPNFFDEVCYTGTGSATTQAHNLGVAPELIFTKTRSVADDWGVYSAPTGNNKCLFLNDTGAADSSSGYWNNTTPTSSVFTVGTNSRTNTSGVTYVAYLFASCPGVSKVGSYTGNGSTQAIACGFTGGARFVMIKRTDASGDWYVWDTARGIITGNDPYLLMNSTAAEVTSTDYIDPVSSGFEISSTAPAAINASGGSFIFLAIA